MARHRLSRTAQAGKPVTTRPGDRIVDQAGDQLPRDPRDAYLAELATLLPGPRRTRAAIIAEIRDGLHEATAGNLAAGVAPERAAAEAIGEFGTPHAVAAAFADELATAHARRTLAAFVLTGPLVGVWWLVLLDPRPWRTGPWRLFTAIPAVPLVAIAVALAVATIAGTGRLTRWLPGAGPRTALAATATAAALCLAADLTVLAVLTARAAGTGVPATLAVAAAGASLLRIGAATTAIRRTGHIRAVTRGPRAPCPARTP